MADSFEMDDVKLDSPGDSAEEVTPNDATDLTNISRAIYVGVEGDLRVTMAKNGATVTYVALKGLLPVRVSRVWATGTTATSIVSMW